MPFKIFLWKLREDKELENLAFRRHFKTGKMCLPSNFLSFLIHKATVISLICPNLAFEYAFISNYELICILACLL